MVKFPQEETGSLRKLPRPWHGPYRVIDRQDPDVTVGSMPHRMDKFRELHPAHHSCPWYGTRCSRPPKWVDQLLRGEQFPQRHQATGPENPEADEDNPSHSSKDIVPTTEDSSHPEGGAEENHYVISVDTTVPQGSVTIWQSIIANMEPPMYKIHTLINPRRACARVTVVVLCVCVSAALAATVSVYTCDQ